MEKFLKQEVRHISFGKGIIDNIYDGKIQIDFSGMMKVFKFPDVFDSFLMFEDELFQLEIKEIIAEKKKREAEEYEKMRKDINEKMSIKQGNVNKSKTINTNIEILNKGDLFATHKDVLNLCFGFQYEHFQPAYKVIDDKYAVWFPSIARKVMDEYVATETSNGWINILSENDTLITEKNEDKNKITERESKYALDRFVFAKFDGENYQFIGVYRLESMDISYKDGYKYRLIGTTVNLKTMEVL